MSPVVVAAGITIGGALLEGALAGRDIRKRLSELRRPSLSPPFAAWIAIGVLYYVTCFAIAYRLLRTELPNASSRLALALLIAVIVGNALWNLAFFRRRDLRLAWRITAGYAVLVVGLAVVLAVTDAVTSLILLPYLIYLGYGTWWTWSTWRLNS